MFHAAQLQSLTEKEQRGQLVASVTSERFSDKYRALLFRSGIKYNNVIDNRLIFDIFYEDFLVSFTFYWSDTLRGELDRLVDKMLTSIEVKKS